MKKFSLYILILTTLISCKKEATTAKVEVAPSVKRVIRITPWENKFIELEDGSKYGMGENLYNRLVTKLQNSGKYVVVVNEKPKGLARALIATQSVDTKPLYDPSDRLHFDFAPITSADFSAEVDELTFVHGSKGAKRFAGFTSKFTTPFNDGNFTNKNEFPERSLDFVNGWFGTTFDPYGNSELTNSVAGVTAGEEGEFNVIVANIHYRRDKYLASSRVTSNLKLLDDNITYKKLINANGTGFLFALGVTYQQLSIEFGITRRTAFKETFDNQVAKIVDEIDNTLLATQFRTKIEIISDEGIILNAGKREGIKVGDVFLHNANGVITKLQVAEVFQIGSLVKPIAGDIKESDNVVLSSTIDSTPSKTTAPTKAIAKLASSEADSQIPDNRAEPQEPNSVISIKSISLDPPVFSDPDGNIKKGIKGKGLMGAYYLWRWAQYDQAISTNQKYTNLDFYAAAAKRWNTAKINVTIPWKQGYQGKGIKIAILDSGVDYNHKNLYSAFSRDYAGQDFVSYDERPFDDNSHGTSVAGIAAARNTANDYVGIAPEATILAYKIFDPFGNTTSASIYGAFDRAINDGAKVILCAWDTKLESDALQQAIELAHEKGVLVVTAAGDNGENILETAHFPARYNNYDNMISVASVDANDKLVQTSGRYSNYGVGAVDIAAPGQKIQVLLPRSEIGTKTGTDLAAAHVAGALALLAQKYPDASAAELKSMLLTMARTNSELSSQISLGRVLDLTNF